MADCKIINYETQDLRNAVTNRTAMHTPIPDQTAEQSLTVADFFEGAVRVEPTEHAYQYTDSKEKIVDKSVTDDLKKDFIRKKGEKFVKETSEVPDNKIKAAGGTKTHAVLQDLLQLKTRNKGTKKDIQSAALSGDMPMSPLAFNELDKYTDKLIAQIQANQNEIDPKGKMKIYAELSLIDAVNAVGGTIDVLVIYSDNTADVLDFKTVIPSFIDYTGTGEDARLISNLVKAYKIDGFNMQISEYKKLVVKLIGVKRVRRSRIIPIHMQLAVKGKADRKTGSYLLPKITKLELGDDNEYITQIPVAGEMTGVASLDDLITQQSIVVNKLNGRLKEKGLSNSEREDIQNRIQRITNSTNKILISRDFKELFISIKQTLWQFKSLYEAPTTDKDGNPNPKSLTIDQLRDYRDELSIYADLVAHMKDFMADYKTKATDAEYQAMYSKIITLAGHASLQYQNAEDALHAEVIDTVDQSEVENGRLKPQRKISMVGSMFDRISEIANPIYELFNQMKDEAFHKTRKDMLKVETKIEEKQKALFLWARAQGLSNQQAWGKLINSKTGNFFAKLKSEFYDRRKLAMETRDIQWIKSVYELKDSEAFSTRYNERKAAYAERLKSRLHNLEDNIVEGELLKSAADYKREFDKDMINWEKSNNLMKHDEAWFNDYNFGNIRIKDSALAQYKSEEFGYIESNPALLDFYNTVEEFNSEWRKIFGFTAQEMPLNFFANIRKDALERLTQGNVSLIDSLKELKNNLKIREEDIYISNLDPATGEKRHSIPIPFFNALKDSNGNYAISEKSWDVGNVMIQFSKVAYNYKYMSEIEARTMALKDYIGSEQVYKEIQETTKGDKQKGPRGEDATTNTGTASGAYQLFSRFVDYYMYGVVYEERGKTSESGYNSTKALLVAKNYLSAKVLGFPVIPAVAAYIQGRTGMRFMASKGMMFTSENLNKSVKLQMQERVKTQQAAQYFDVYAEDYTARMAQKLSSSNANKAFSMRTLFAPLRYADENIDSTLVIAMMQSHGLDAQGNLKRLKYLPEGSKTLWDLSSFSEKEGFKVEGMEDSAFIAFRNSVREVSQGIKGTMSHEDASLVQMNLYLNLAMQFKTWMPGVIKERFGKLRYNKTMQTAEFGRIRAYLTEYEMHDGVAIHEYIIKEAMPKIAKLALALSPIGLFTNHFNKMSEQATKDFYAKWALKNPDFSGKITEEMFMEAKQAQINAMIAEVRAIMIFLSVIALMGYKGDDDQALYKKNWATRNLMKVLKRAESELAFTYTPREFIRLTTNPLPIMRLLTDVGKTLGNSADELRDYLYEENSKQDKTPVGYYSSQWIVGVQQMRRLIEIYEQDKKIPGN